MRKILSTKFHSNHLTVEEAEAEAEDEDVDVDRSVEEYVVVGVREIAIEAVEVSHI